MPGTMSEKWPQFMPCRARLGRMRECNVKLNARISLPWNGVSYPANSWARSSSNRSLSGILKWSLFPAPAISGHGSILRISPWAFMWAKLAKWSIFHQTDPEVFIGRCYQSPGTRLCDISAVISTTATPCSMAFQNTNMIACSGFYTQLHTLSACYSSSVTSVYSPL